MRNHLVKFPDEFEDLLNSKGKRILAGSWDSKNFGDKRITPIDVVGGIIDDDVAADCVRILDKTLYAGLKNAATKIDEDELLSMKKNYTEKLAKNLRMKSLEIGKKRSKSYQMAHDCGLIQMMSSQSLQAFGQAVTRLKFGSTENYQIICYQHGDYVSPHNDHHPENPNVRDGFFDIHIMFSNKYVQHQLLVYEKSGFLNGTYDISTPAAIAVYKLPFWHYTTPLIGKNKYQDKARRWLLLRTFEACTDAL